MNYWILSNEAKYPEYHIFLSGLLIDPKGLISPSPFNSGKSFRNMNGSFKLKPGDLSRYGKYTDKLWVEIQGAENLFVISEHLSSFLSERKIKAEFFDIEIIDYDLPEINYKIVNLLEIVHCINEEDSELLYKDLDYDEIQTINNLVLDASKMVASNDMFLLDKVASPVVVISDELKKSLDKSEFQGLKFYKIDEFTI